jgi:hypothetical protein
MAKKKAVQRGGVRDGAGRPSLSEDAETVRVATDLPADLVERLDAYAKSRGEKRAAVIRDAVVAMLNAQ